MNKKLLSVLGCLVISTVAFRDVKPLTNTKAKVATFVSSALTGAAASGIACAILNGGFHDWDNQGAKAAIIGGSGLISFGLGYLIFESVFSKYTPAKRVTLAESFVFEAENDSMLNASFESIDDLAVHINARFGTNWPLLCARERLLGLLTKLSMVFSLISNASADSVGTSEYSEIMERCKIISLKLPKITKIIEYKIDLIIKYPDYVEQRKLFEKYQEAERQRAFEAKQCQLDRIAKQTPKTSVVWVR